MADYEPPITLGLSQRPIPAVPGSDVVARPEDLQFDKAIPLNALSPAAATCVACKAGIQGEYFHAQGVTVCPQCAKRIEAGQQAPPAISLVRAALFGAGAAFAGFLIYATVAIAFDLQIGLISILVGMMVGKAVRKGSNGLGGRPQQFLAIGLTYFAITTSYIPVAIYDAAKKPDAAAQTKIGSSQNRITPPSGETTRVDNSPKTSLGGVLLTLVALTLAAPFLSLTSGVSGIINIAIIFFGIQQAWKLTGRSELMITGPYTADAA